MTPSPLRYRYLDALRGYAILGVILVHCTLFGHNDAISHTLKNVFEAGAKGVILFFLISSYTLTKSFLEGKNKSLEVYFIKRFFRIAPLYYLGIFVYLIWIGKSFVPFSQWFPNVALCHLLFPNALNSVVPGGWSIACEVAFYVVLPFIIPYLNTKIKAVWGFFLSILLCIFNKLLIVKLYPLFSFDLPIEDYKYFSFFNQLPVFVLGILCYHFMPNFKNIENTVSKSMLILGVGALLVISSFPPFSMCHIVYAVLFALILCLTAQNGRMNWVDNSIFAYFGRISYSLYIVHFLVLHFLFQFHLTDVVNGQPLINFLLRFCLTLFFSSLISLLSFQWIEKPFITLGGWIVNKRIEKYQLGSNSEQKAETF